jgi:hypothetical protein
VKERTPLAGLRPRGFDCHDAVMCSPQTEGRMGPDRARGVSGPGLLKRDQRQIFHLSTERSLRDSAPCFSHLAEVLPRGR